MLLGAEDEASAAGAARCGWSRRGARFTTETTAGKMMIAVIHH